MDDSGGKEPTERVPEPAPGDKKDEVAPPKTEAPQASKRVKRRFRKAKEPESLEHDEKVARPKKWYTGIVKDVAISGGIVASLLLVLYLYSGVWPPMVVIESSSMMHGDDSSIGIIDTGDLTLVKKINSRDDVITYVEASTKGNPNYGFKTYSDFGNVIVYKKNGLAETPVIHRAIAWIEYNKTASVNGRFRGDIPDIGVYNVSEYPVPGLKSFGPGPRYELIIHISSILQGSSIPHSGFVTKGDHNTIFVNGQGVDQELLQVVSGRKVEPVKIDWVIGRAEGELPWFGLFKLWITGHNSQSFPKSSVNGLITTVIILIIVPIVIDFVCARWKKKKESRKTARDKSKKKDSGQ